MASHVGVRSAGQHRCHESQQSMLGYLKRANLRRKLDVMRAAFWSAIVLGACLPCLTIADETPSAPEARAYIIWPADGATIDGGKLWVRFGLRNMGLAPAGVEKKFTGHHHLIIDAELPPLDEEIPADRNHVHYGKGFSEGRVTLAPGVHTLQLLLADQNHVPHDPPIFSKKITVKVP
jgi:hypothetical protein